ncbi:MAG: TolB family protein, partial [Bryobacteraceae bacterium]
MGDVVWTPDGRGVLAPSGGGGGVDWHVFPIDGSEEVVSTGFAKLAAGAFSYQPRAWADGFIYYRRGDAGASHIWRIKFDGNTWKPTGSPERLTFGTGHEMAAAVSADGRRMAFASVSSLR